MNHILVVTSLLATLLAPVHPAPAPAHEDLRAALRPVLDAGAPGVIALVRHGRRVDEVAVGTADLGTGRPMSPDDHVRVGSVTKTFVAVVALQLVAEHRLRLDAPVSTVLPGVLPYGAAVTVRQLLDHTSGVPDYFDRILPLYTTDPGTWLRRWQPSELVASIAGEPPLFPPGSQWHYSNTDYILMGMAIERITGRSLAAEVRQRVITPLRLRDTTFPTGTVDLPPPAAQGYLTGTGGAPLDVTEFDPSVAWAAGAMISTVADLATFYRELFTGALLPDRQLAQLLTTVDAGGFGYGLGIFILTTPCGPAIGHNGAIFGFGVDAFTSPDGSRQVVLADNAFSFTGAPLLAQEQLIAGLFCT